MEGVGQPNYGEGQPTHAATSAGGQRVVEGGGQPSYNWRRSTGSGGERLEGEGCCRDAPAWSSRHGRRGRGRAAGRDFLWRQRDKVRGNFGKTKKLTVY